MLHEISSTPCHRSCRDGEGYRVEVASVLQPGRVHGDSPGKPAWYVSGLAQAAAQGSAPAEGFALGGCNDPTQYRRWRGGLRRPAAIFGCFGEQQADAFAGQQRPRSPSRPQRVDGRRAACEPGPSITAASWLHSAETLARRPAPQANALPRPRSRPRPAVSTRRRSRPCARAFPGRPASPRQAVASVAPCRPRSSAR
nr:hypothetical protein [uncultured bacterium]BAH89893.1 hypothetical protein [uncultured bacterium]BAH90140.1 hypothetical protein [uncultured bacterium]